MKIISMTTHDFRFPTSRSLDGSDAIETLQDYAYPHGSIWQKTT